MLVFWAYSRCFSSSSSPSFSSSPCTHTVAPLSTQVNLSTPYLTYLLCKLTWFYIHPIAVISHQTPLSINPLQGTRVHFPLSTPSATPYLRNALSYPSINSLTHPDMHACTVLTE